MADLGAALLRAALGHARQQLGGLLDADAVRARLGVPLPPDEATWSGVQGHLQAASAEAALMDAQLGAGPTLASAGAAAGHLVAAMTRLRSAAALLGGDDDAGLTRLLAASTAPAGIGRQLGLTAPAGVAVRGGSVVHTLRGAADLAGVARIDSVVLTTTLDAGGTVAVALDLRGARLTLGAGAGAVVDAVLGAAGLAVTADLGLTLDTSAGLTARGSLGPVVLPARSPNPLLHSLSAAVVPSGTSPGLALTARSGGSLGGAVTALLAGFGLRVPIDPAAVVAGGPAIGSPVVLAPDTLGLTIAAGPVTGGGFISVQQLPEGRRYSGALQLDVGPVAVTAFGVLTERPDGFSFVVVLSASFTPPIEVALGFTLNAVGGLLGVDVRVDTDVLRDRLRSGVLERLLFPPDKIGAAPAILQTLADVFPPSSGGFVVGPMLALGWGRPVSFVRLDLAVVLALPETTVILLARLRVTIPVPEAPLVDLRAEVYGEFSARRVLVLASLVDSRIAMFSVSGDVGLLTRFGDDATFAISAGGFHPRFAPPPELTGMRRITVELSPPVGLQLRVEGYVALTTNTVQVGGKVELAYSAGVAGVHGYLALDAMIRFDPFGFEVDIAAGVGVEVLGFTLVSVDLSLHLSGPAPWRVAGTGRVRLPWPLPDPSISLGPIEWGPGAPAPGPAVSPAQLVADALSAPAAWARVDTPGRAVPVTLREVQPAPGEVLVDPWSVVRGTQTQVPLDTDITRVGAARVAPGENRVLLGDPLVTALPGARWSVDRQPFPLGQFTDLADDVALSAPSFEQRAAGLVVDPADLAAAVVPPVQADLAYETSFPFEPPLRRRDLLLALYETEVCLQATSAGRSALRATGRYAAPAEPIDVHAASAARPVTTDTLAPVGGMVDLTSWSDAAAALRDTGWAAQLVGAGV
jgi:hypothetical protein